MPPTAATMGVQDGVPRLANTGELYNVPPSEVAGSQVSNRSAVHTALSVPRQTMVSP